MKGNSKKLALLMIITVIATFILATTVTAGPPGHRAIRGQYAATGGGTQLIAVCGFPPPPPVPRDDIYIPNGAAEGAWAIQAVSIQAVFTFEPNGTGTASTTHRVVTHYSIAPQQAGLTPYAGIRTASYSFAYTAEKDGMITITADPDTFISTWISGPNKGQSSKISTLTLEGTISPDGKTIILNGGLPEVAIISPPLSPDPRCTQPELISNNFLILIWQHDIGHK
jgi:hypothetical protein